MMRTFYNKTTLFLLLALFFCSALHAQITISGEVIDADNGDPLIGANVIVKDGTTGVTTDFDGAFEIKTDVPAPITLVFSYIGYTASEMTFDASTSNVKVELSENAITTQVVEVKGQRISEKQKAAPLTVESMDLLAIKATPSDNFYDGLGSLKGVDLTAASLGFKVINTRGFNSTSPVRSLQIIDGVDNQAPGLNFSLGNFLGSSELDVLKVEIIQGAASAFYGPNAFNGVISMETKSPFLQKGLSASVKAGERNMLESAIRWADAFKNEEGFEWLGYKLNFSYLQADDWEAENYDPVFDTETGKDNAGRFDAVNIYGDEYVRTFDESSASPWGDLAGVGQYHRTGYREIDLVDYSTRNLKANLAVHFRTNPKLETESPEFIVASSFSNGTTVYQGDNRFSLRNILFFQNRLEFRKKGKYFIRAYATQDDAGDSYDPYFTALRLQESARTNGNWSLRYTNFWKDNDYNGRMQALGFPDLVPCLDEDGNIKFDEFGIPIQTFDREAEAAWYANPAFQDSLFAWHAAAEAHANGGDANTAFYEPGTDRFQQEFERIRSAKSNSEENGTRFFDKSALYHVHGEYKFEPTWVDEWVVGANARVYRPRSDGTIFYDSLDIRITNREFGVYTGVQKKFLKDKLTANATVRVDKNENFDWLVSPAASLVWKPKANNYLRVSFSSAIRNPTLSDQFLNLNVGRAILSGNINGSGPLYEIDDFLDFIDQDISLPELQERVFEIDPIQPEKVRTIEVGYRSTLFNKVYVDAGYYFNFYDDFLGFRLGVQSEFNPENGAVIAPQAYRFSANSENRVTTQGFAIGLSYYFFDYFKFSGNYSWNKLNKEFDDDPIIPAFNTPEHKFNIGVSGRDIDLGFIKKFGFNINYKWIEGFLFEGSPQFTGLIPTYDLLDAQISFPFDKINTTLKIGASNLLDNQQFQTYGGPVIGRLAYVSLLYEFKKQ